MKSPLRIVDGKRALSLKIVSLMLTIAPLCLMLAAATMSAYAQVSDVVTSATTSTSSPGDWTQFLRDNMERWNPYETALGVNNVGNLKLKWTQSSNSTLASYSNPVTANGVVYVGSGNDSHLYAIDAATGQNLWSFFVSGFNVKTTPAVANGVVYIGVVPTGECGTGVPTPCTVVYALDARTGAELWRFTPPSPQSLATDITVADGAVCFGVMIDTVYGSMYALNASIGAVMLGASTFTPSTPSVANGVVYFGNGGSVTALTLGFRGVWNYVIKEQSDPVIFGAPAVTNGVVYFATNSNIYAVNASSGETIWVDAIGSASPQAVANGVLYAASGDNLYALNAATGERLWSFAVVGNFEILPPAVANGVVYLSATQLRGSNQLIALNASMGAKLWSVDLPLGLSAPIVSNGNVYVTGSSFGSKPQLYAFSVGSDLFLRINPSATTVHQGDLLTYAFPVWNLGPDNAVQEVLNTQVPAGTTFDYIRISGTPGLGTCTHPPYGETGQIVCHQNASMAPNTTWTVRLTVKVTAPTGTVITGSAATMADTFDPNMANNMATVSLKVQ